MSSSKGSSLNWHYQNHEALARHQAKQARLRHNTQVAINKAMRELPSSRSFHGPVRLQPNEYYGYDMLAGQDWIPATMASGMGGQPSGLQTLFTDRSRIHSRRAVQYPAAASYAYPPEASTVLVPHSAVDAANSFRGTHAFMEQNSVSQHNMTMFITGHPYYIPAEQRVPAVQQTHRITHVQPTRVVPLRPMITNQNETRPIVNLPDEQWPRLPVTKPAHNQPASVRTNVSDLHVGGTALRPHEHLSHGRQSAVLPESLLDIQTRGTRTPSPETFTVNLPSYYASSNTASQYSGGFSYYSAMGRNNKNKAARKNRKGANDAAQQDGQQAGQVPEVQASQHQYQSMPQAEDQYTAPPPLNATAPAFVPIHHPQAPNSDTPGAPGQQRPLRPYPTRYSPGPSVNRPRSPRTLSPPPQKPPARRTPGAERSTRVAARIRGGSLSQLSFTPMQILHRTESSSTEDDPFQSPLEPVSTMVYQNPTSRALSTRRQGPHNSHVQQYSSAFSTRQIAALSTSRSQGAVPVTGERAMLDDRRRGEHAVYSPEARETQEIGWDEQESAEVGLSSSPDSLGGVRLPEGFGEEQADSGGRKMGGDRPAISAADELEDLEGSMTGRSVSSSRNSPGGVRLPERVGEEQADSPGGVRLPERVGEEEADSDDEEVVLWAGRKNRR